MIDHAVERLKERAGIPKRAAARHLGRVITEGMPTGAAVGQVRDYLDRRELRGRPAILGPGDLIYILTPERDDVITVLGVPSEIRKAARAQLARWRKGIMAAE